jgi:hypothetical protein
MKSAKEKMGYAKNRLIYFHQKKIPDVSLFFLQG